mmetsp:Transcript_60030/g.119164  ORF Transcript_60030/g.119164 Transcript_60030/m.119164 type:complete len:87 (-) Transcript_60030:377-637(-)
MTDEITCFHCRSHRVIVGTASGAALLWNFSATGSDAAARSIQTDEAFAEREELRAKRKEKFRANVKVRGRFPKTQGFSNAKGFGGR